MTKGDMYTIAGGGSANPGNGGSATSALVPGPTGVAVATSGNVLIVEWTANRVQLVADSTGTFFGQSMTSGDIYTIAGLGGVGYNGDGIPATSADIYRPRGIAVDGAGNVLISDTMNNRIRVVAANTGTFYGQSMTGGDIYTIAGNGTAGYSGDGGSATSAEINNPLGLAVDASGNVLVPDLGNNRVRVVAASTGTFYGQSMTSGDIYTVAGNGTAGYSGDGGPATGSDLSVGFGLAVDAVGNILVDDGTRLRAVAASTGTFYGQAMTSGDIYTIAGNGTQGYAGDGGPATSAEFDGTAGVAVDATGNVFIADGGNGRIREVAAYSTQTVTFTSTAPSNAAFGGATYTASATGGLSGNPVTFSSATPQVCTVAGSTVSFVGLGTCTIDANQAGNAAYNSAPLVTQSFPVGQGTPSTPTISNLPASGTYGGGFTATVSTTGDGTTSVSSSTPSVCTASGLAVSYVGVGTCTLTAHVANGTDFTAADGGPQNFPVGQATPSTPTISNLPASGTYGGGFTATVSTTGDGTTSVSSSTPSVCTASGLAVSYVGVGTCTLTAHVANGTDFTAADGGPQNFPVGQATPSTPTISNLPASGTYGGGFTATVSTTGDGTTSVSSSTPSVCTASGLAVSYVGVGTCTLTAHVANGTDFTAADGGPQNFPVGQATPSTPTISNLPASGTYGGGFTATVSTTGDGTTSVSSSTPSVCTASGLAVSYVGVGTCSLTAHVANGTDYLAADGNPQSISVAGFAITTSSLPSATPGASYGAVTLQTAGAGTSTSPYTTTLKWKKVTLPKGLRLSSAGVLSGKPSSRLAAGPSSVTVQVTETVTTLNGRRKVKTPTTVQATIPLTIA